MEPEYIFIPLAIILSIYVLLVVLDILLVAYLTKVVRRISNSINITLSSYYTQIKKTVELLKQNSFEISEDLLAKLEYIEPNSFDVMCSETYYKAKSNLSYLKDSLFSLISSNEEISNSTEFCDIKRNISELLLAYRSLVIKYNTEVVAYNYWIKFLPSRYIHKIFKKKTLDLAS